MAGTGSGNRHVGFRRPVPAACLFGGGIGSAHAVACGHVHAAAFQVERGGAHAGERDDGEDDAVRGRAGGCHDLVGLGGRFDRGLLGRLERCLRGLVVALGLGFDRLGLLEVGLRLGEDMGWKSSQGEDTKVCIF